MAKIGPIPPGSTYGAWGNAIPAGVAGLAEYYWLAAAASRGGTVVEREKRACWLFDSRRAAL